MMTTATTSAAHRPALRPAARAHASRWEKVPEALKRLDQWVIWRKGKTDARGKFPKIPYNPITGAASNDKDPATWKSFAAAAEHPQIGFCFSEDDPYTGVDLDDCVTDGVLSKAARAIVEMFGSYPEYSPGTGVKIWVRGKLPKNITGVLNGVKVEVYGRSRFFTVTGRHVPGTPTTIADGQAALDALAELLAATKAKKAEQPARQPGAAPVLTGSADDLQAQALGIVAQLKSGHLSHDQRHQLRADLRAVNRALIRAVADVYNSATTIGDELLRRGCTYVSTHNGADYYSGLPGDQHSHEITLKCKDGRVWSFSPRSRLYTDRAGLSAFDTRVLLDYSGNAVAATMDLLRQPASPAPEPAPQPAPTPAPEPIVTPEQLAARKRDAERKREARQREAQATLVWHQQRLADDTKLPRRARALAATLLAEGTLQSHTINATLVARLGGAAAGWYRRKVQRGFEDLERAGYGQRHGGTGPSDKRPDLPYLPATWTWTPYRVTVDTDATDEVSPSHEIHDLSTEESSEQGARDTAAAPAVESPPQPTAAPEPTPLPPASAAPSPVELVPDGAAVAPVTVEQQPEALVVEGGASYDPAAALPGAGRYTGRTKHTKGLGERWAASWGSVTRCERAAAPAEPTQYAFVAPPDVSSPVPELVPPTDPETAKRYWKITGAATKARKAGNKPQARALERQARALMEPAQGAGARPRVDVLPLGGVARALSATASVQAAADVTEPVPIQAALPIDAPLLASAA